MQIIFSFVLIGLYVSAVIVFVVGLWAAVGTARDAQKLNLAEQFTDPLGGLARIRSKSFSLFCTCALWFVAIMLAIIGLRVCLPYFAM
jgi:hypothetical protein